MKKATLKAKKHNEKRTEKMPKWNLGLLYSSEKDPQIEKDVIEFEKTLADFARRYDTVDKEYLMDDNKLLLVLNDYKDMEAKLSVKFLNYFCYLRDIDASNESAQANITLLTNRATKAGNLTTFFSISLGHIPAENQKRILNDPRFAEFKVFLWRIFEDFKYRLSVPEEKIMNLKNLPAHSMWVSGNQRILNVKSVLWKGKHLPLPEATALITSLKNAKERHKLADLVSGIFEEVAPFAEAEINAIVTNKKISDELREYTTPYENTIRGYRNDPQVIENLVKVVTENFNISNRFYKLKAKLLKMKRLRYWDRGVGIGNTKTTYSFAESVKKLREVFGALNPKLSQILRTFIERGQIDAPPRIGKKGGAYCSSSYELPTFVLLNHSGDLKSLLTMAHEMGHAFHSEFSREQGPIYFDYSTALAETASTLFESIALDSVIEDLPDNEKAIALHGKINSDVSTIFRQIACFNFEKEIHETIRVKGFMSKEDLADCHNRHMKSYLGRAFELKREDGYFFVDWSHLRRFFYVYSYAYGLLVSKALLRRYREDKSFWHNIEKFLSAGGKDSPENILKDIGLNVSSPDFFREGLREIEEDIDRLEKLTGN